MIARTFAFSRIVGRIMALGLVATMLDAFAFGARIKEGKI